MKAATALLLLKAATIGVVLTGVVHATPLTGQSALDLEAQKIRFPIASSAVSGDYTAAVLTAGSTGDFDQTPAKRKSPIKAFLLSAAVPGLGQWYYGSRIKPFVFLGVEVTAWSMYFKWHGEGEDLTDAFEAFNRLHWSRYDYENRYLAWTYGETDDDSIVATEVSHHLPETETQQYFEMTGKYDQFAWGWDDAVLDGHTLDDYNGTDNLPPRINGLPSTTPYSSRRLDYEQQRYDANSKFDRARKMIMVSIANRLASAMEAFLVTRHKNQSAGDGKSGFLSQVKVDARLKSYHERHDTPFVKFTYIF